MPRPLYPGERDRGTHQIGGWMCPRTGFNTIENRKISYPSWESNPISSLAQLLASHCTDWAVRVPRINEQRKNYILTSYMWPSKLSVLCYTKELHRSAREPTHTQKRHDALSLGPTNSASNLYYWWYEATDFCSVMNKKLGKLGLKLNFSWTHCSYFPFFELLLIIEYRGCGL
jgi:hypothetical protein